MSEWINFALDTLLRSSLLVAGSAIVIQLIVWATAVRSPNFHRLAWVCVLLQGYMVMQFEWEIPWYEAPPPSVAASDAELPELDALEQRSTGPVSESAVTAGVAPDPTQGAAPNPLNVRRLLFLVWTLGMIGCSGVTVVGYGCLLASMRRAVPAKAEWQAEWSEVLAAHGIQRRIPLYAHPRIGPLLCWLPSGYRVVVPLNCWRHFSAAQRRVILEHELAHYVRGDVWTTILVRILALPHWFNPCAWWAVRKFEEGGEWACDAHLAARSPQDVPEFARALLELVDPTPRQVGVSAARGACLRTRLSRLLDYRSSEDSAMKRIGIGATLVCVLAIGLLRIQLVAQEPERNQAPDLDEQVASLRDRLPAGESPLLDRLKQELETPAGQVVFRDRIASIEDHLRDEARGNAVEQFFEERFVESGERVSLREEHADFRKKFLQRASWFNEDLDQMRPTLLEVANQMQQSSELEKLLARFLNHEAAPVMLYVEQLRHRLRPGTETIEMLLGRAFVKNEEGEYIVRPSRREDADRFLQRGNRVLRIQPTLHRELALFGKDFAEKDQLDRATKAAMGDPLFAMLIGAEVSDEEELSPTQLIDRLFDHLEGVTVDTSQGLSISQDERPEIEEILERYERTKVTAERLRTPLRDFADQIKSGEPLEDGWKKLLVTDVAMVELAKDSDVSFTDSANAVKQLLGEVLAKGEDGKYRVAHEDPEEVAGFVREMFRAYRKVNRRLRFLEDVRPRLNDLELRNAFGTPGGKFVFAQAVQSEIAGREFEGVQIWIEEHFDTSSERYVLREGAQQEIEEMLRDMAEVRKELSKDDF